MQALVLRRPLSIALMLALLTATMVPLASTPPAAASTMPGAEQPADRSGPGHAMAAHCDHGALCVLMCCPGLPEQRPIFGVDSPPGVGPGPLPASLSLPPIYLPQARGPPPLLPQV